MESVKLLEMLEKLRIRLNKSGVERTIAMRDSHELREECYLYKKSLNLFLEKDYVDILKLVEQLLIEYRKVEGNDFGR